MRTARKGLIAALLLTAGRVAGETATPVSATEGWFAALEAGEKGDHELAVSHLLRLQRENPYSPEVLLALASATDQGGRDGLGALAWYHAHLLSSPGSPAESQILQRIRTIEEEERLSVLRMFRGAEALGPALVKQVENADIGLSSIRRLLDGDAAASPRFAGVPGPWELDRLHLVAPGPESRTEIIARYYNLLLSGELLSDLEEEADAVIERQAGRPWAEAMLNGAFSREIGDGCLLDIRSTLSPPVTRVASREAIIDALAACATNALRRREMERAVPTARRPLPNESFVRLVRVGTVLGMGLQQIDGISRVRPLRESAQPASTPTEPPDRFQQILKDIRRIGVSRPFLIYATVLLCTLGLSLLLRLIGKQGDGSWVWR